MSFSKVTISSLIFCNFSESCSLFSVSASLLPVRLEVVFSIFAISSSNALNSLSAVSLSFCRLEILFSHSTISFFVKSILLTKESYSFWQALYSVLNLISSCCSVDKSPLVPKISASYFANSCWLLLYRSLSSFALSARALASLRYFSISLARDNKPVLLFKEPPVREPPAFTTWPSRVTTLKRYEYFLAIDTAELRSSAITILPSKFCKMPLYSSLQSHKSDATPIKPKQLSIPFSFRYLGLIVAIGRNVALPPLFSFSVRIALLASSSLPVTMFCIAPPKAVSIATA